MGFLKGINFSLDSCCVVFCEWIFKRLRMSFGTKTSTNYSHCVGLHIFFNLEGVGSDHVLYDPSVYIDNLELYCHSAFVGFFFCEVPLDGFVMLKIKTDIC